MPDDGYIRGAFTWHMKQAQLQNELKELLWKGDVDGSNKWFKFRNKSGDPFRFLLDVRLALALEESTGPERALDQLSWHLIVASVRDRFARLNPDVLAIIVLRGILTPTTAFHWASEISSPEIRPASLIGFARGAIKQLANTRTDSTNEVRMLAMTALENARAEVMAGPPSRAGVRLFAQLAELFDQEKKSECINLGLKWMAGDFWLPHELIKSLTSEALRAIGGLILGCLKSYEDCRWKIRVLSTIVPRLSERLRREYWSEIFATTGRLYSQRSQGANRSRKSTLSNVLLTLARPRRGALVVAGNEMSSSADLEGERELRELRILTDQLTSTLSYLPRDMTERAKQAFSVPNVLSELRPVIERLGVATPNQSDDEGWRENLLNLQRLAIGTARCVCWKRRLIIGESND